MFRGAKNILKKTDAAVIIQNLLDIRVKDGTFSGDPRTVAKWIVTMNWDSSPELFNGSRGQRPHKLSLAAASMAKGVEGLPPEKNPYFVPFMLCLGTLMQEVMANYNLYPFNSLDEMIFSKVATIMEDSQTDALREMENILSTPI